MKPSTRLLPLFWSWVKILHLCIFFSQRKNLSRISIGFTFSAKKVFEWIIRIAIATLRRPNPSAVLPEVYQLTLLLLWTMTTRGSSKQNIKFVGTNFSLLLRLNDNQPYLPIELGAQVEKCKLWKMGQVVNEVIFGKRFPFSMLLFCMHL